MYDDRFHVPDARIFSKRGTLEALESGFFRFYAPPRMPLLPKQRKRTSVRSILASGAETVRFYTNKRQLEIYETDVTNTV